MGSLYDPTQPDHTLVVVRKHIPLLDRGVMTGRSSAADGCANVHALALVDRPVMAIHEPIHDNMMATHSDGHRISHKLIIELDHHCPRTATSQPLVIDYLSIFKSIHLHCVTPM